MLSVRYPRGDILLKQTGVNSFLGAFPIGTLKFLCDPKEDCKGFEVDDGRVRNLKFTKINVPAPGTER